MRYWHRLYPAAHGTRRRWALAGGQNARQTSRSMLLRPAISRLFFVASLMATAFVQRPVAKADPVLHEYLEPDPKDDIAMAATTPEGTMPAAVETNSGTIRPPDLGGPPPPGQVYGQQQGGPQVFRPDRDTSRPHVERYDDPFTPTLTPFKRSYAYDAVREDFSLYVRDAQLRPLAVGGVAQEGDDPFFADMQLQVSKETPTRIPTVGPQARLLRVSSRPQEPLSFLVDGADNWFVVAANPGKVRLVASIAVDRQVFAADYADSSWRALPAVVMQPRSHRSSYLKVARAIGISRSMSPRTVVKRMVAYFRSFAPSDEAPTGYGNVYLDLALSKKGVCRHRAFAFLVTALNMGIPTRLVHNEAHAWVEVRDHLRWHRIDLGGAALNLTEDPNRDRPHHVPMPDLLPWPGSRDSGADLAHRQREEHRQREGEKQAAPSTSTAASEGQVQTQSPPEQPSPTPSSSAQDGSLVPGRAPVTADDRVPANLRIDSIDLEIFRGKPLRLRGRANASGRPCAGLRIDLMLSLERDAAGRRVGSLSTDARGFFAGAVVLPRDLPIGDHELYVQTSGHRRCGAGEAR